MSERESEEGPAESGAVPVEPGSTPVAEPARPGESPPETPSGSPSGSSRRGARTALWLAGLLILILAGVALSPFWAPQIEPLFPWSENRDEYAALVTRLAAVEARPVAPDTGIDAIQSAVSALARRVDQLELATSRSREAAGAPDPRYRCDQFGCERAGAPPRSTRGRRQTRPRPASGRSAATRAAARCDRDPIRFADGERSGRFEG